VLTSWRRHLTFDRFIAEYPHAREIFAGKPCQDPERAITVLHPFGPTDTNNESNCYSRKVSGSIYSKISVSDRGDPNCSVFQIQSREEQLS